MFSRKLAATLVVLCAAAAAPQAHAAEPAIDGASPLKAASDAYRAVYPQMSTAAADRAAAEQPSRKALYDAVPPAEFGGAWFDPPSGVLHVATTTRSAGDAAAERARELGVRVETPLVRRSFADLERQAGELRAGAGTLGAAAHGQVGLDVQTNRVVVAVPAGERAALVAGGVPAGVSVIDDPGDVSVLDACTSRAACETSVRAGAKIWRTTVGNTKCSVGFTGRDFSTGVRWTITAGHCSNGFVDWGTGANTIGPMFASMYSGPVDGGAILTNHAPYTGQLGGQIYRDAAYGGTVDVDLEAPALAFLWEGDTVCLSANYTDVNGPNYCGLLNTNSDPNHDGMARVDGLDACGGDSGGGWYGISGGVRTAYGIHHGSTDGCHGDLGGSTSWFSAWPTIQSNLLPGVNIETR
jgi:streptogrisin C